MRIDPRRRSFPSACSLTLLLIPSALAQDPPPPRQPESGLPPPQEAEPQGAQPDKEFVPLAETVVTATRFEHELFYLPQSVSVADEEYLRRRNNSVGLDALSETMGVWVEKRNGGSSDPVMRGFSGGNILALVDGDSLTTFWGEGGYAGDDMYGKVDSDSIERIEVIRGPASVIYGSNALGGVINFITRRPPDYTSGDYEVGGRLKTSFWSATNGVLTRADVYGATDRFRYRLGYSMRDIGDTRGGGDLGLLTPSGVDESNFDWNSEYKIAEHDWLELNAQVVNRNALPKFFRPTQRNNNDRQAVKLRWHSDDVSFGDRMSWGVYYQNKEDERYWLDQDKSGIANWESFTTDFQTETSLGNDHLLTWGIHATRQYGESPDDEQFTITTPATGTQKASPDSTWDDLGIYVLDEWDVGNDWTVSGSLRFDSFRYEADGNVFYTNPGSTAAENVAQTEPGTYDETALTGGLGLSKLLDPDWMVYGSWARGYRLFPPGFGLRQSGFGIQAPTDGLLDPTTADQFELGTRVRRSWWSLGVAGYYSFLKNVQQPVPGSYQGQESIDLDGSGTVDLDEGIFVTTGADGYVTGIEIDSEIVLDHFFSNMQGWTWHNGFMANYGLVDEPTGEEPLRHTHPARFLTALRWEDGDPLRGRWFEFIGDFAARYDQVSDGRLNGDPGYLNDPQDSNSGLITDYGLPSYEVFHLRGGITLAKGIDLTVAVENLFDTKYRTAHSRMDAAGRNVMVGVTATF